MKDYAIALSDLLEMLKRKKGVIISCTLLFAALLLTRALVRDPLYLSEGSFRDKGKSDSGLHHSMSELILGGGGEKRDSETISVLKSSRMMEVLIKKLNLQGAISEKLPDVGWLKTVEANLAVEWAYLKNRKSPVLPEPEEALKFTEIHHPGELYTTLNVVFLDDKRFRVEGGKEGHLGIPYSYEEGSFTLERHQPGSLKGRSFTLTLSPLKNLAKELSESLIVKIDSDDRSLIRLKYFHPNRYKGVAFVNNLMKVYQEYLEEEHKRVADKQIGYLEMRELEMAASLKRVMQEHADNLGQDLSLSGFIDSQKELEFLSAQLAASSQKLMDIALDEKRLHKLLSGTVATFDPYRPGTADAPIINEILQKIREHKMGLDSLEMALKEAKVDRNRSIEEFSGLNVASSKELSLALSHERQANEMALKELEFVIGQIDSPDFEITSLTAILSDPVSLEKIQKASSSSHALKDENNRTSKELERLKEELQVQKEFLKSHLSETSKLLALKGEVLKERNYRLQAAMTSLLRREIELFQRQLKEYVNTRLHNLESEKTMIVQHQSEIKGRLAEFPQKWIKEQLLQHHLSSNEKLVENITAMVESKNISNNLELIQSAPLDRAIPAVHPTPPRLILWTVVGGLLGAFFSSLWTISHALLLAIPLTLPNLSLNGFKTSGKLTYGKNKQEPLLTETNLDTLRRALSFLPEHSVSLIAFSPFERSYASLLTTLLRKRGESVVCLDLSFKENSAAPGLKQYLEGSSPLSEILKNDTIASGGVEPFLSELLNQDSFKALLVELKHRYSWIIASSDVPLTSAAAENLIPLFDAALIALKGETLAQIEPLLSEVKKQEKQKPVVFMQLLIDA